MTNKEALAILKYNSKVIHQTIDGDTDPNEVEALDMAIKALEQQPTSDDCVSRQAVDELCFRYLKANNDDNIAFYEHFRDLPLVTPTQSWIPVSERLPEPQEDGDFIFTDWVQVSIRINVHQSMVCSAYYCFSEMKWYTEKMCCGEIIAWQPLPKPYEEKRGNEDGSN